MDENACSQIIIGAAIEVHKELGPGLFESVYEIALAHELELRGLRCVRQKPLVGTYKGADLGEAYRIDLLVEDLVVVEIKALQKLAPVHSTQLLTYLRLAKKRLGLLLNFHEEVIRDGIKRIANQL